MFEGTATERWDHTSLIAAILINANRKKHSKTVKPHELNPMRRSQRRGVPIRDFKDLKVITKEGKTDGANSTSEPVHGEGQPVQTGPTRKPFQRRSEQVQPAPSTESVSEGMAETRAERRGQSEGP